MSIICIVKTDLLPIFKNYSLTKTNQMPHLSCCGLALFMYPVLLFISNTDIYVDPVDISWIVNLSLQWVKIKHAFTLQLPCFEKADYE
jgi:hypothetical protein